MTINTTLSKSLLCEISWEVCNQMGGIYTVIRTKLPPLVKHFGDRYCMIGPAVNPDAEAEFDPITDYSDAYGQAVVKMRDMGYDVQFGRWLVTGRPKVILLNPTNVYNRLDNIKRHLLEDHAIDSAQTDKLYDEVILFGDLVRTFLKLLDQEVVKGKQPILAQCHEWMSAPGILDIDNDGLRVKSIFTTHATMIGRFLAMNDPNFYENLPKYNWQKEAKKYGVLAIAQIEHRAALAASIFTTVSQVTARECEFLQGKRPDVVTPNGLNIERFSAYHEVQNRHMAYKERIHRFVMGHFFHSYSFDLDNTLYFFTSGRYEYHNKGYDLTLRAIKRLNEMMKEAKVDTTVVMFFITRRPSWSINPDVLESRGVMEEVYRNCKAITDQLEDRLFYAAASSIGTHTLPNLNELVDDYWRLRYRRTLQSWKSSKWPIIVTHNLKDDVNDDILTYLRKERMVNSPLDKVKVVYHPDFISSTNPLFGIDYTDFIRGCHLGVFPSYYEPWGYTPLECVASGVPTVTTDLSGFGKYVQELDQDHEEAGVHVLKYANKSMEEAAEDMANYLFHFVKTTRRYRMIQRNKLEDYSEHFDWKNLAQRYIEAYNKALED